MSIISQERTITAEPFTNYISFSYVDSNNTIPFGNFYSFEFRYVIRYFAVEEITEPTYLFVCKYWEEQSDISNYKVCLQWIELNSIPYIKKNVINEIVVRVVHTVERLVFFVS